MAFVRKRRGRWRIRYVDGAGRQVERATHAKSKVDAQRMADDLERQAERVRLGLEKAIDLKTFNELWSLYEPIAKTKRSWSTIRGRFKKHLLPEFGARLIHQIDAGDIDTFLANKLRTADNPKGLSPQTCEHLRVHLAAIFTFAIKKKLIKGENPGRAAAHVEIPEHEPRHLELAEVALLLKYVPDRWRGFFAVALFTGMRKGEVVGLRVANVDLERRTIMVSRSYAGTTKAAKVRYVPIPDGLLPYLRVELGRLRSEWLFPALNGGMLSRDVKLTGIMRRALRRAGLLQGYDHLCRTRGKKKSCGYVERRADSARFDCPNCEKPLEVKAVPIARSFKDLRSTFGTFLVERSGDIRAAQKILGHSDQKVTQRYAKARDPHLLAMVNQVEFAAPARSGPVTKDDDKSPEAMKSNVARIR